MRFFYLIGVLLIVILVSGVIEAIKPDLEKARQKKEEKRQAEERERNWQAYKTKVPWRYCHDINHILSTYPSPHRLENRYVHSRVSYNSPDGWSTDYIYTFHDDMLEIVVKGNWYKVKLKACNIEVLSIMKYDTATPKVYRPQGSTGWEDRLIWLSEHIEEIIRQEKEEYEEGERRKWNEDHSPLP